MLKAIKSYWFPALIALTAISLFHVALGPVPAAADEYKGGMTTTTESTTTTSPVPQSLLTLQVNTLCVVGTSMIEVVVSNDSHLPVSIDIIVDDEPRSGLVIQPGQAIFPKWDVAPGSEGTVATTVTYYDGGQGIFDPVPVTYKAIDCTVPAEVCCAQQIVNDDNRYVTPSSTVPVPSVMKKPAPLSFAG